MKRIIFIISFLLSFIHYDFCVAQQTTSYQNSEHKNLNVCLNGKVKFLKQVSYSPNILCDTIPVNESSYTHPIQSGMVILLRCATDTLIYIFNEYLLPEQINDIKCYIDEDNRRFHKENIYNFDNGNMISEKRIRSDAQPEKITYKYDQNNNMVLKIIQLSHVICKDSLEYDNNNNLIKKSTYKQLFWNEPVLLTTEEYQYDARGHLVAEIKANGRKNIYVYDARGNKIEEGHCLNYNGKKCNYKPLNGFIYDESNRMTKNFSIGKWSPHNTDTYYQYDEQGRKVDVKGYYISKDTVLGYHYAYEYNEQGQQIKEEEKVGRYRRINFVNYKILITTYDDYNNITRQGYYIANNHPVKIIRYVYSYDSFGNWTKREKYEGKSEEELSKMEINERIIEYYDD